MNTLNIALRVSAPRARTPDELRSAETQTASYVTQAIPRSHRADIGGSSAAGDMLTRVAVVLLSSINSVMWEVYTEARVMGAIWAVIAIGVAIWIKRDTSRR